MTLSQALVGIALAISLTSCNLSDFKPHQTIAQLSGNEAQIFQFNADEDAVIEGKEGVVIAIPKGGLVDSDGNIVTGTVTATLIEALDQSSQLLHELGISDGNKIFENLGTIQLTFTSNGEEVFINPDNPAYAEIPTSSEEEDVMVYSGERTEDGNIDWKDSTALPHYLTLVPFDLLTFTPPNFTDIVNQVYGALADSSARDDIYSKELLDSLYFGLSHWPGKSLCDCAFPSEGPRDTIWEDERVMDTIDVEHAIHQCHHILPLSIQTIAQSPFDKTFIATQEFEKRLEEIHRSNDRVLLELYINNLDKNLWEVDQMAAQKSDELFGSESEITIAFRQFADQKLTNVKDAPKSALLLQSYYQKTLDSLSIVEARLAETLRNQIAREDSLSNALAAEYLATVVKRNRYRMKKYGFKVTSSTTLLKGKWKWIEVPPVQVHLTVENAESANLIRSYIVLNLPKSILKLNNTGGNELSRKITSDVWFNRSPMVGNTLVTIAYIDETPWLDIRPFQILRKDQYISVKLTKTSNAELADILKQIDSKKLSFNKIESDLLYHRTMQRLYEKRERFLQNQLVNCMLYCKIHEGEFRELAIQSIHRMDMHYDEHIYIRRP